MKIQIRPDDALVVVDVQNDFCPGGALAVADGDAVVPLVNAVSPLFGTVVLTQDWHPEDHVSFASTHGLPAFTTTKVSYGDQVMWPDHCVRGTAGAEFHPGLDTRPAALVLRKGTRLGLDSYSGFTEADRGTTTGLAGWLRAMHVGRVFVVGLATDFCVSWTAMDARQAGFAVVVLEDACRGIDLDGSLSAAWGAMEAAGVVRASTEDLAR